MVDEKEGWNEGKRHRSHERIGSWLFFWFRFRHRLFCSRQASNNAIVSGGRDPKRSSTMKWFLFYEKQWLKVLKNIPKQQFSSNLLFLRSGLQFPEPLRGSERILVLAGRAHGHKWAARCIGWPTSCFTVCFSGLQRRWLFSALFFGAHSRCAVPVSSRWGS